MVDPCFECEAPATHHHHVVPRSMGGNRTVPLCHTCHGRAHGGRGFRDTATLTKAALDYKRSRGEKLGGQAPYGQRLAADGVHLEADPAEAAVVETVHRWRGEGLSLRAIAARLAADGHVPRGGAKWDPNTVTRIAAAPWHLTTVARIARAR